MEETVKAYTHAHGPEPASEDTAPESDEEDGEEGCEDDGEDSD